MDSFTEMSGRQKEGNRPRGQYERETEEGEGPAGQGSLLTRQAPCNIRTPGPQLSGCK